METTTPTINNLGSSNWIIQIVGSEELTFKINKFTFPGVDAGVNPLGNRTNLILQTGGSHLQFENISFDFILDENMLNYRKLYKWMVNNTKDGIETPAPMFIHFVGNDKRFQGVEVEFYETYPISLSSFELDSDGNDTDQMCTVTFTFTGFDFVDYTDRDEIR